MRIKNITSGVYGRVFLQTTARDLGIISYVFFREWSSIPGLWHVIYNLRTTLAKRRWIQSHRRVADQTFSQWFEHTAVALPLEPQLLHELQEVGLEARRS